MGFSGIVIGVVCGESKVLGGSFGCLAGLGSRGVALVKKEVRCPKGGCPKVWQTREPFSQTSWGHL